MRRHLMGEFEHLVLLAAVRLGDEAYGVSIIREIETQTGRDVSQAAAYLTLKRLEEKGWMTSSKGEPTASRGHRPRRYFRVTVVGRDKLREARVGLLNMWSGIADELK
jgi:PadR family transcriptional regulator PadR